MDFRTTQAELDQRRQESQDRLAKGQYLGEDLSEEGLLQELEKQGFVAVAHNVPSPVGRVAPGSIVVFTWQGKPARWLNETVFIWRKHLG
jgi:hypothetical protein